jgi:hypothetical protein
VLVVVADAVAVEVTSSVVVLVAVVVAAYGMMLRNEEQNSAGSCLSRIWMIFGGLTRRMVALTAPNDAPALFLRGELHKVPFCRGLPGPLVPTPKLQSLVELEKTRQKADDKGEHHSREHDECEGKGGTVGQGYIVTHAQALVPGPIIITDIDLDDIRILIKGKSLRRVLMTGPDSENGERRYGIGFMPVRPRRRRVKGTRDEGQRP